MYSFQNTFVGEKDIGHGTSVATLTGSLLYIVPVLIKLVKIINEQYGQTKSITKTNLISLPMNILDGLMAIVCCQYIFFLQY